MNATRKLIPLVLFPALFATDINLAQAAELSLDRAVWRASKDLLVFKGQGEPGAIVDAYLAGTITPFARATVSSRGQWRMKLPSPEFIPCAVRVESGPYAAHRDVYRAPDNCATDENIGDNNPPEEPTPENTAPVISGSPNTQVAEGQSYSFRPSANDADNDDLTFSIANRPSWASFNSSTGQLSGTPDANDTGTSSNIRISVSDGTASASLNAFSITVSSTNQAPTISGTPASSVAEGSSYRFTPSANDADGDNLTFSIANCPSWASLNSSTGVLSGTPDMNDAGTSSNIRISVSDGTATASLSAFSITVSNSNQAPTISGTPASSVSEGSSYRFAPNANDADGDNLTFLIANRPTWASFNNTTGVLSGTPDMNDAGTTSNISISVSDGTATASLSAFNITVSNTNQAPTISGTPSSSLQEGSAYSFTPSANDPDGDDLSFSISNLPSWASFNSSTGALSGTPDSNDSGVYSNIVISVSDGSSQASLAPFGINVADVAEEGGTFRFASNSYDVEEGSAVTLTVTRSNSSGTATVNYGTYGVEARHSQDYTGYVWTALDFLEGESSKTIRINTMSDSVDETAETFEVHLDSPSSGYTLNAPNVSVVTIHDIEAANTAPVITGNPDQSVLVGDGYVFTPNASDADNDTLTFSVSNLPSWANFNSSNGTLSGTPAEADEGSYNNIVISVTDGTDTASLSPMTLVVEATQTTPTTGSVTVNWVAPSTRTDGSSLSMSDISGYRLYMGTTANNLSPVVDLDDSTANNHVMDNLETGTYYFAITAYDTIGNESDLSNVVAKDTM
ncbi:MAG: putative Ig domain-containing protein [Candidatus Thiodiazotropha sp. LLP2]